MSVAQHDLMACRQGFPRERKRDSTGADRSELHDTACRSLDVASDQYSNHCFSATFFSGV